MTAALPLVLTVFVACVVEAIEALTIVLASGLTREWRSTFQGMAVALVVLAAVVGVLGPTITLLPLTALRLVVGAHPVWQGCAPEPRLRIYFANHSSHLDTLTIVAVGRSVASPKSDSTRRPSSMRRMLSVFTSR